MAEYPEALAQMARLLGEERLRSAPVEEVRSAVDEALPRLVDGLLAEAVASDDVTDRDSALAYVHDRVRFLQPLLRDDQRELLLKQLTESVASW
jgi:hypothetical protein